MQKVSVTPKVPSSASSQQLFISSAVSMGWQLAVTFLAPVIAGVEIDKHLHSSPWATLIGLIVAIVAGAVIVWRSVTTLGRAAARQVAKDKEE